jgi:hypothetical protein
LDKKSPLERNTVIKIFKISIVLLIVFQLLQIFVSYFLLDFLLDNYKSHYDNYYKKTEAVYYISIEALFEFFRYFILIFLVIQNQKIFNLFNKI